MIEKIGHYSMSNPASIFDEEAITALELAGRTAAKVNECVDTVNDTVEAVPGLIADKVQEHIDGGAFDEQVDKYAGELRKEIEDFEQEAEKEIDAAESRMSSKYNALDAAVTQRIDNLVAAPSGSTQLDTEVIDTRLMFTGDTAATAGEAVREQIRLARAFENARCYCGNATPPTIHKNSDGSVTINFPNKLMRMVNGVTGTIDWGTTLSNIADNASYSGKTATVTVPAYHSLVYKVSDGCYYLQHNQSTGVGEVVLLANGWSEVLGGTIADEWVNHNQYLHTAHNAQIIYHTWPPKHKFIPLYTHTDGNVYLKIVVNTYFTLKYVDNVGEGSAALKFTEARVEPIASNYLMENDLHVILVPPYQTLVYNQGDDKFHIREYKRHIEPNDVVLVNTAWAAPISGCVVDNYNTYQSYRFDQYMNSTRHDIYPPHEDVLITHAGRMLQGDGESILYFTDPHLAQKWEDWHPLFDSNMSIIKSVYDACPAHHVICGGDWLGSTDTKPEACYRLGFVDGKMREMFGDYYHLIVGNHDTNYQGVDETGAANTGRLTPATVADLWYGGKTAYYDFNTNKTRFFVFDTQLDWENTLTDYFMEQLVWFIGELKANKADNIALGLHICHVTTAEAGRLNILAECVTAIAHAFNTRGSYTLNGTTYHFSGCYGKVRFMLCGHTHKDWTGTVNNIPVLTTTNVRAGDSTTFDLLYTDYSHGKLYADRIGTGESRVIDI